MNFAALASVSAALMAWVAAVAEVDLPSAPVGEGVVEGVTAADHVVLRDGSSVRGLILSESGGPRGGVELILRRGWAERHHPAALRRWERGEAAEIRQAARERRERLARWRRDRAGHVPAEDRILAWIDREQERLAAAPGASGTPLMAVRLPARDLRTVNRRPRAHARLLALGWLCGLTDVESMPIEELSGALESRGFLAQGDQIPSLSALLPLAREPEALWVARRAATELALDDGLRFLRFQDLTLPEGPPAVPGGLGLATAISGLKRLLEPDAAAADLLAEALRQVERRGRAGAQVTSLEIAPDLSVVAVEIALWIRDSAGRWTVFGSRSARVAPAALGDGAGANLAGDPQIQTAFSLLETLGIGSISPEMKARSLRIGAATQLALQTARSAFLEDLELLRLPIFEDNRPSVDPRGAEGPRPPGDPRTPVRPDLPAKAPAPGDFSPPAEQGGAAETQTAPDRPRPAPSDRSPPRAPG